MTKISIAVPSYNYAQYLTACLASIQQQNYKDFEWLLRLLLTQNISWGFIAETTIIMRAGGVSTEGSLKSG
jgi:hypothetical protein